MPKLEIDEENKFRLYAQSRGCKVRKVRYVNHEGAADRFIFCPGGRLLQVEMKRAGGSRKRPSQINEKRHMDKIGHHYFFADGCEEAIKLLDDFLDNA